MSFITNALMRLARQVLQGILASLTQQQNIIQELALAPMRAMVQQVTNGVWRGNGANAFVQEVSTMMIPGVGQVSETIGSLGKNLQFAQDVIERADQSIATSVKSLADEFGSVFS